MTGSTADADDLLQDTFERAMTRPPADLERPWRPWLVRVAANLARDALRSRRRRKYIGPWLPCPADTSALPPPATPEARYGARESASYAFLKALEALTPNQRAVLVLRDVFEYSGAEVADTLDMTVSNVKVTLHRARKALREFDDARPTTEPADVSEALSRLMAALLAGDAVRVAALLAEGVVATSDAGGEFTAARRAVSGADRVARFLLGVSSSATLPPDVEIVTRNGLPALDVRVQSSTPGTAERMLVRVDVHAGLIVAVDIVIAADKV